MSFDVESAGSSTKKVRAVGFEPTPPFGDCKPRIHRKGNLECNALDHSAKPPASQAKCATRHLLTIHIRNNIFRYVVLR